MSWLNKLIEQLKPKSNLYEPLNWTKVGVQAGTMVEWLVPAWAPLFQHEHPGFRLITLIKGCNQLVQAEWNGLPSDCNLKSLQVVFVDHPWTHAENSMGTSWIFCGHMLNMSWTSILFHAIHSVHYNYLNSLELLHAVQAWNRLEPAWNIAQFSAWSGWSVWTGWRAWRIG